mgnify:CR=1 FL=1
MARRNPIIEMMGEPLPSLSYQRAKLFRPTRRELLTTYDLINKHVFKNAMYRPQLELKSHIRKAWGQCFWLNQQQPSGSHCRIELSDKWFCRSWFVSTLAHEMVHQYQFDVYRFELLEQGKKLPENSFGHGPSFFMWRDEFAKYDLPLKTFFRWKKWLKYQDFNRC